MVWAAKNQVTLETCTTSKTVRRRIADWVVVAIISIAALVGTPIGGALIAAEGGHYLHVQIFCGRYIPVSFFLLVSSFQIKKSNF